MSKRHGQDLALIQAARKAKPIHLVRSPFFVAVLIFLAAGSLICGFYTARLTTARAIWPRAFSINEILPTASRASMPVPSNESASDVAHLPAQQQAEQLLDRAIHRDGAAIDLISQSVDSWLGQVQDSNRLFGLVLAALKSDDLRVRTAGIEVDLAANNLSKTPQSVSKLIQQLRHPADRPLVLWRLGALGNRGVEPEKVLAVLLNYSKDRTEETRYWAVEGLAMLGSDATVDPLLDILAHDPAPRVRERAACSLAQSGMLTREDRLEAVPQLLNLADDDSLETSTRELVYATLRTITGAALGNDATAWREWWASHDPARERPHYRTDILHA